MMESRFKLPSLPQNFVRSMLTNFTGRAMGALGVLLTDADDVMSPAMLLDKWAEETPSNVFLRFEGQDTSYGEMRALVRSRAAALRSAGLAWGDVVAVMMDNHPAYLVNVLALSWIGATASLVNTGLADASLRHALLQTSPRAILAGSNYAQAIDDAIIGAAAAPELRLFEHTSHVRAAPQGWRALSEFEAGAMNGTNASGAPLRERVQYPARTSGRELFAYIFTSGTTGLPKGGKMMNARALVGARGIGLFTVGLSQSDVVFVCLPLFHANGLVVGVCSALAAGATVALSRKLSVSRFWDDVTEAEATTFVYIGEVCRYLLASPPHPKERAHRVRAIVGNGMRPDVWPRFVERFQIGMVHEFYAATEGNVNMTNVFAAEGSVGRMPPLPGYDNTFLARFDPDTEKPLRDARGRCIECKRGEVGELLGRIDESKVTARFDGYVSDEATEAKIIRNVEKKGDAFFRSGDLMRKDVWGFFYFVDRIGDTFRWKGENVATNEVQDAIGKLEVIQSSNVYGVQIPGFDGRAGMAALSLVPGGHFAPETFYEHVTKLLPAYAVPAFVRLLPEATITATFKLKKTELVKEAFDPAKTGDLLFYRDDKKRTYEPIDAGIHGRIVRGELRF